MLRSRLPTLRQFPSTWHIQCYLLHDRKIEDSSGTSNATPTAPRPMTKPLTADDLDIKTRVLGWSKRASINLRLCADDFTARSKSTFSQLGTLMNQITGYEEIEALKRGVVEQEARINACRQAARKTKQAYNEALIQRANSQREVNDLIQRKTSWTATDVARFTELVPADHRLQQEEVHMKVAVDEAEDMVEREFSQLMQLILTRYHEEQVWSDKIRSASTYGSLVALGLNMAVFITAILLVEPWKRRRLVQAFEAKVSELSVANAKMFQESMDTLGKQQETLFREWEDNLSLNTTVGSDKASSPNTMSLDDGSELVEAQKFSRTIRGIHLSQRHVEIAVMTSGAFVAGILTSILLTR